ncbi:potassium-transporting ATPase subunit C [Embleya scabrispora]|uniref:potassium-transporting ATPase subunit C n=1 Tax=Embleya scabrispora TaxID=159449 RepID=UPI000476C3C9|nr:potassium-transporting ATPase subunit C [Embleya scabrispora]MYS87790.1 potassium-transporting ATPase subunit C [Streptomyces sp. SID5474]
MPTINTTRVRVLLAGLRALIVLTLLCGLAYPFAMTGIARVVFPDRANGSRIKHQGKEVGSSLIGQSFDLVDTRGNARLFAADGREVVKHENPGGEVAYAFLAGGGPLTADQAAGVSTAPDPLWFQPRPSVSSYDALASGASNYGPENPILVRAIKDRKAQVAAFNGVGEDRVPVDAVTASGSGLDPHISKAYALLQVERVARARRLDPAVVRDLVDDNVQAPVIGVLGSERVNVLELNLALARADKRRE